MVYGRVTAYAVAATVVACGRPCYGSDARVVAVLVRNVDSSLLSIILQYCRGSELETDFPLGVVLLRSRHRHIRSSVAWSVFAY